MVIFEVFVVERHGKTLKQVIIENITKRCLLYKSFKKKNFPFFGT